jgi:hypothetical protein
MQEPTPEIHFRALEPKDVNFLLNSWLKSFRPSCPLVSDEVYFREQKRLVLRLLEDTNVLLACDPVDPGVIWGYLVGASDGQGFGVVHWVYTKHALRKFGIARALLAQAGILAGFEASHLTDIGRRLLVDHPGLFTFNPWRAR